MRGRDHQDEQLEEFIAARTQDLHHDAYQLTAAQQPAEQLVIAVLAAMRREHIDLAQAGSTARLRMARVSARDNTSSQDSDASQLAPRFRPLARLSPRQRAALVLFVVDGHDEREIARDLHLTTRATTEALGAVPYDELPGASPHSGELRSLLEDFGDLATSPSASATLADVRAVPPPPRRPWWTYVAALLVIAVTVATLVITQRWRNDWLHTPNGLNRAHGTHFPAYTAGYKLVAIHDVAPGPAQDIPVGAAGSVALECDPDNRAVGMSVSSELNGTFFQKQCAGTRNRPNLIPAIGTALVAVNDFSRDAWPIAVYQKVPIDEYPVATRNFQVQHDLTISSLRSVTSREGHTLQPTLRGEVLTLRAAANHPNGTFSGTLRLPAATSGIQINVVGLLSPTTTGHFRIRVDNRAPWTTCGSQRTVTFQQWQLNSGCSLVDRYVPQVTFDQIGAPSAGARTTPVRITVTDARGPWTLQVVADAYKFDASAVDDGANG
ncbi:MAG TPA: sigma factor-like helix-turn-helix DNA-binding protein [Flexivirga sp.]|uniref:sigma factor-like helix-turn-helix DNA-binding protein n=1 Tax=Flexivirga sp. TaxID=1962927 RepID=UPI002C7BF0A7|nr:sigma factor-like helix-turn-helix DNA-binding protein [Flexivirga sp.]HWC22608.1 sigma factor-like helix-turn-helix DNA-binding protein [Flexivirga sp.]